MKAVEELLKLKQRLQPANPWIIHGFRGKPALAQDYVRHGFYLSFGEKYQEESLRAVRVAVRVLHGVEVRRGAISLGFHLGV